MAIMARNYERLTLAERRTLREAYVTQQDGKCWYCKQPLTENPAKRVDKAVIRWGLFPMGFQNHPVHLHHSHVTGLTIGAVHMKCNAYLWQEEGE
jgi:hypothetical protein